MAVAAAFSYTQQDPNAEKLLNEMITPPESKFIDSAILNLYSMEAITSKDDKATLTELGKAMKSKFSMLSSFR